MQLKKFTNYSISPKTFKIFSMKSGVPVEITPSKKHPGEVTFILHENGVPHKVTFMEILKDNWTEICNSRNQLSQTA